jgi:riboflavin kinase/FMN adenylyltransferase
MEVAHDLAALERPRRGSAVTIGAYDGVHVGHQQLLARLREVAAARGCTSAVVTFDRHPALVVRPASAPRLLTDLESKLELLAATGVDLTVVVHFDRARSEEPAEDFVRTILVEGLDARVVAVGSDFHFGHNREGNVPFLNRIGPALGFEVLPIELFADGRGPEKVSSTRVRAALAGGDVTTAGRLLGRPHRVRGIVVSVEPGEEPLVEVVVPAELCLPADGVYAGWYRGGDAPAPAAVLVSDGRIRARLVDAGVPPAGGEALIEFASPLRTADPVDGGRRLADSVRAALR